MKSPPERPSGAIAPERAITLPSARERPMQRLLLAGCPDFWRLWSVGLVVFTARWLETVAGCFPPRRRDRLDCYALC